MVRLVVRERIRRLTPVVDAEREQVDERRVGVRGPFVHVLDDGVAERVGVHLVEPGVGEQHASDVGERLAGVRDDFQPRPVRQPILGDHARYRVAGVDDIARLVERATGRGVESGVDERRLRVPPCVASGVDTENIHTGPSPARRINLSTAASTPSRDEFVSHSVVYRGQQRISRQPVTIRR